MQEPPDEGGLAVIHASGSGEPQQVFLQMMINQALERGSELMRACHLRCEGH
jgi:hypothetical protein